MNAEAIQYALAKQIPVGGDHLKLSTDYGDLELSGEVGRKSVKAIRLILMMESTKAEEHSDE